MPSDRKRPKTGLTQKSEVPWASTRTWNRESGAGSFESSGFGVSAPLGSKFHNPPPPVVLEGAGDLVNRL